MPTAQAASEPLSSAEPSSRFENVPLPDDSSFAAVAAEVCTGLSKSPKTLSPWLFYDETGSRLFEQITEMCDSVQVSSPGRHQASPRVSLP